jgi:defect-in-organelle-trafficking protein DotC
MYGKILILSGLVSALVFSTPVMAQDGPEDSNPAPAGVQTLAAPSTSELGKQLQNIQSQSGLAAISQPAPQENTIQVYNPQHVLAHEGKLEPDAPPSLDQLQTIKKENKAKDDEGIKFDIRKDAIRESAVSYGARGGLAWRTYQIRKELNGRARSLDKVFDFAQLLIPAPSGLLIEPPIVSESLNALLIQEGGQQAAVSDRLYNIVNNARIVSAARTWRTYLEREWGEIEPPPDILRPQTDEERELWSDLVAKGWEEGVTQANEIFEDDLNVLMADFQGMVRYRSLLAQGMISPPYALQVDRGITGGGEQMRVGDRAVQITGVPELITGSEQWQPANR